jgi:hypothetical protein
MLALNNASHVSVQPFKLQFKAPGIGDSKNMAPSGFKINRQAIARMTRDIQREFDKHPISVPIRADTHELQGRGTNVYNGPVVIVHGDRAQIASGNRDVSQSSMDQQEIAPGFEAVAQALVSTLEHLAEIGLSDEDRTTADDAAKEVLSEVTKEHPDRSRIRRRIAVVKGILSPLALGVQAGVSDSAREWARTAVEQLTSALP